MKFKTGLYLCLFLSLSSLQAKSISSDDCKTLSSNKSFVKKMILRSPSYVFGYADKSLRNDPDFLFEIAMEGELEEGVNLNKENVLTLMKEYPNSFPALNERFKNDKEVILVAAKKNPSVIKFISKVLQADKDLVLSILRLKSKSFESPMRGYIVFKHIAEQLKTDKEVVMAVMTSGGGSIIYSLSDALKKDREVVVASIKNNGDLEGADKQFLNDRALVLLNMSLNYPLYSPNAHLKYPKMMGDQLKKDKAIVMASIAVDWRVIKDLDPIFKHDKDIALLAIRKNYESIDYLDPLFKQDKSFILSNIKFHPKEFYRMDEALYERFIYEKQFLLDVLRFTGDNISPFGSDLMGDMDIILSSVNDTPKSCTTKINKHFVSDKTMALAAVRCNPDLYKHLNTTLKNDRLLVLEAVEAAKGGHFSITDIPDQLLQDRHFILALIKISPELLNALEPVYQADKEIVIAAFNNAGLAIHSIRYEEAIDKKLQQDRDVLLAYFEAGGSLSLEKVFLNRSLRKDKSFVMALLNRNESSFNFPLYAPSYELLKYLDKTLADDNDIVLAALFNGSDLSYNIKSFQYASERLKDDRAFVLSFLQKGINIYPFISERLKQDLDIARAAIELNADEDGNLYADIMSNYCHVNTENN